MFIAIDKLTAVRMYEKVKSHWQREMTLIGDELALATGAKREELVIDWRKREQSRAAMRQLIEIALDEFLPRAYSKDVYELKCERIYHHVYDSYAGQGQSMYSKEMVM